MNEKAQISIPNLPLPLRQQSVKSLDKTKNHYREFQHALNMLKTSVEELWRLELAQLQKQQSISPNTSNIIFDLQVPSIYSCRAVLPMASETIPLEIKDTVSFNSPITLPPTPVTSIQEIGLQSSARSISSKQTSVKSLGLKDKKRNQYESGDHFTKYGEQTALLHLRFQCSKHLN